MLLLLSMEPSEERLIQKRKQMFDAPEERGRSMAE
jgi:hypothetical protein